MNRAEQASEQPIQSQQTKAGMAIKATLWTLASLFLLLFFSLLKLPEIRLKNLIHGHIVNALASQGLSLTTNKSEFSYFLGMSYDMEDVIISGGSLTQPIKIQKISISPSVLPLFLGRFGAGISLKQTEGKLKGSVSFKATTPEPTFWTDLTLDKLDLGKLGVFQLLGGVQAGGITQGTLSFSGTLSDPKSMNGTADLKFSKIAIESQSIAGFNVPKSQISDGELVFDIVTGKVAIKKLQFGKHQNPSDDIYALGSGEVDLNSRFGASKLNADLAFGFSQKIQKAFLLLDALLADGKTGEGAYAYHFAGTFDDPVRTPKK